MSEAVRLNVFTKHKEKANSPNKKERCDVMNRLKKFGIIGSGAAVFKSASVAAALLAFAAAGRADRAPDVPASLQVPDGNKVSFHAYAVGVQIYVCKVSPTDPTRFVWAFKAPEAVLFASAQDEGEVAIHYAGPTWESNSGSKVVGARVAGVTVDPTAIPWLLLRATSTAGPGIFEDTTYIQRVNTVGGKAPTTGCDAAHVGEEVRVPYSAEYFFYRADD